MSVFDPSKIRRALVVAPHPDDESLGCGGLLAILAEQNSEVVVVFVTDGGASHVHSQSWSRERLATQRRIEAQAALSELGLCAAQCIFFGLKDAEMPAPDSDAWASTVRQMSDVIGRLTPDLIIAPWRRDPHSDHRASWCILRRALLGRLQPAILEYAIWLNELGLPDDHPRPGETETITIDISRFVRAKKRAVAAHRSQTTDLINDDPAGFRLTCETIKRLTGPVERYFRDSHVPY